MSQTKNIKRKISEKKAQEAYKEAYKEYEENKYTPKSMALVVGVAVLLMGALILGFKFISGEL